jgi:hypothetical protein
MLEVSIYFGFTAVARQPQSTLFAFKMPPRRPQGPNDEKTGSVFEN